ncbi:hypothetical protein R3I93_005661 [Phoxinus phoxinus]|uniref:SAMD1-like winged helix (WH) domain-containing protein n=1 Tax=Phoxinus phoxinus TaxID=58324 RepID=A0AAN9DBX8_9TELE
MSEPKYREWILETIDSLRSRKARPDLERICRMVRRRHGSDPDKTRVELEKLIQEQTVLKVSYKGSISYRNAAKVQRKCRKRSEQTESAREQTKHASFNNNGDSALSLTDQEEECEEEEEEKKEESAESLCSAEPLPPQTSPSNLEKEEKIVTQPGGNCFVSCGATVCSAGSVKASASKDKRLVTEAGGESDASRGETRGAVHEGTDNDEEEERKTCSSSPATINKPPASPKPKLKGSCVRVSESPDENSTDLGDRLVAAVRSLSRGSAATRGHAPPGLKEILDFLSTQSGMPGEKLTRNRVKVVLERELERGRLRRTRLGHIALHARANKPPSARLLKSALQDRHLAKKEVVKEEERMEEEEKNIPEENISGSAEDDPKTIPDEDPTGVRTDPASHDPELSQSPVPSEGKASSLESSQRQQEGDLAGAQEQAMCVEPESAGTGKHTETADQLHHPSVEDQLIEMSEAVKAPSSVPIRNCKF